MKIFTLIFFLLFSGYSSIAQNAKAEADKALDLIDKKQYAPALSAVNKALAAEPKNVTYLQIKATVYELMEQYQKAYDVYTEAIKYNPNDSWVYNNRGLLLKRVMETDLAIDDFTMALSFEDVDSVRRALYLNRGAAKVNKRDFESAYVDFMEAYKLDSLDIGVLNNLASVCDEVGKGDQTLKYLYRVVELDPTFVGGYGNIGFKHQEMGDHKKAIEFFDKVLKMEPDEPLAYSNRAFNKYKLGDYQSALSDANKAIQLYPANSFAFKNRALIHIAMKNKKKACADIEKALELGFTKMYGEEVEKLKSDHCGS